MLIDLQQIFLDQGSDEEDSASLADTHSAFFNKRWPGGTFKLVDVAGLINENGNTPDGVVMREFLFPGQKSGVVLSKSVGRRLLAHVAIRFGTTTKSSRSRPARTTATTFLVKVTAVEELAA